ncbi:TPA: right-handed parallel beta-helix repeat-containing protein [Yersinia enterocolitica]|nr:right-handed parallel beta-helix repeat-containing protein [Yersinia enterocolitica]HDL6964679.1 right-handed parallel beta-helix repeat-containing protein [Yersinia enterocolitica]
MKNFKLSVLALSMTCFSAWALAAPGACDVIAGGQGYRAALKVQDVENYVTASTYEELKQYVDKDEQFIFIPGDITITVPNLSTALHFKSGQTVFSDRGIDGSKGALLVTQWLNDDENTYPVYAVESDVRLTGLRFEGPTNEATTNNKTIGMQFVSNSSNIQIDNNEIYNWPWSGVNVKSSIDNKVHHNFIHDNLRSERGYGVVVQNGNAQAEIYCNTFNANRHAIAGSGEDGEGYYAHNNLVLNGGGRAAYHQFDMHLGSTGHGGKFITATDNIFDYGAYGTSNRRSIYMRGVPTDGAITVAGNIFTQPWEVGSQKAVAGVEDSVPSEAEIEAVNTFNAAASYTQNNDGICTVNVASRSLPVNCDSVATVLTN